MSYWSGEGTNMRQVPQRERKSSAGGEDEPLLGSSTSSLQGNNRAIINSGTKEVTPERIGTGEVATFFNFVKASIGSGSFALPWGIWKAGVLVGAAGMVLLGIISVYTMQLMLEIKSFIMEKKGHEKDKEMSFTDMGRYALGSVGAWMVNIMVVGCNLGVCAGYMIFISTNLEWVFNCAAVRTSHDPVCFNTWEIYAILLPILILLTFLPSFKILAYAAYIGSIFLVVAMIVVYVFGHGHVFCAVENIGHQIRYVPDSPYGLAQWFGVTAFLFCVHSMVIPLESVMRRPRKMPIILDFAALAVVGVNLPFAIYGYLLFGEKIQGYVFSNLPGNAFNTVVRAFLSVELTFTFPIVLKPASDIIELVLKNFLMFLSRRFELTSIADFYYGKGLNSRLQRLVVTLSLRTCIVLVSWSVAAGIRHFELCLALVGSLTTTVLAFVLPPLFHLVLQFRHTNMARNIFHIVLLIAGIVVTIGATSINLYMAIEGGGSPLNCTQFKTICTVPYKSNDDHCYEVIAG